MNDRTLWTFGCSHTYGHGLEDCWVSSDNGAGNVPSKLGYASILAEKLNVPLKNMSRPGIGNKHIFFRLQQEITKNRIGSNDIVLIQWSYVERNCIIKSIDTPAERHFFSSDKEDDVLMLGSWIKNRTSKAYYRFLYNEADATWHTVNYINLAHAILKSNGINDTLHIAPPYGQVDRTLLLLLTEKYLIDGIPISEKGITDVTMDQALDKAHPGPKTQHLFADYLFDNFYN